MILFRKLLSISIFFFLVSSINAQKFIEGTIKSTEGIAVSSASITIKIQE